MSILLFLVVGLLIGTAGGMLGIGGGVLLVPVLTELYDFDQRKAAGITLAVLAMPVALPGALRYFQQGSIGRQDLLFALFIAGGFAVGTHTGATIQAFLPVSQIRLFFGIVLIYVAVRMIIRSNSDVTSVVAGLIASFLAWLGYLWMRAIGRKHLHPPPTLGEQIRDKAREQSNDIEYYI